MPIKLISKQSKKNLSGTAIIRLDFNDQDGWRIQKSLPTLKLLKDKADKIVILGHRGRPPVSGSNQKQFSLAGESDKLSQLLKTPVHFINHLRLSEVANEIRNMNSGSITLLENMRFLPGETKNEINTARQLAALGDYFINDAFAVSHRAHASVSGIVKYLPAFAGLALEAEIKHLSRVFKKPPAPVILIIGGAKVKTKLPVIISLRKKANIILTGGAIANTLLYLEGVKIGASLADKEIDSALLTVASLPNIILPEDWRKSGTKILDIGPKAAKEFSAVIKRAKTVIWNGPVGDISKKQFSKGSQAVAEAIAQSHSLSIAGGGETVDFIRSLKLEKKFSFLSSGGGAMLEFITGNKLPGLEALKQSK